MLPSLFVSHGSPTFALEPGRVGPLLHALGHQLERPRAILVVSPHWQTRQVEVGLTARPDTIHDFGGFPEDLYQLQYPAPGAPGVGADALALLQAAGIPARANLQRGLDHGAWVVLMHLYPDHDIPVFQVSLTPDMDPRDTYALGQALAPLGKQGVLLLGTGGITHNLYDFRMGMGGTLAYVPVFAEWLARTMAAGDLESLLDYRRLAPEAVRAHPTEEHLLPLFFALGAAGPEWTQVLRLEGGIEYGMLSMDAYRFGPGPDLGQLQAGAGQTSAVDLA